MSTTISADTIRDIFTDKMFSHENYTYIKLKPQTQKKVDNMVFQ